MRLATKNSYVFDASDSADHGQTADRLASHNGPGAHARACEEAERGVGHPASDRAGVWGGAPR
jgi:hypothetical protein